MSSTAVVTLIATVVAVQGSSATIDKGVAEGLHAGDRGSLYYELRVNGERKRVPVGEADVESTAETVSTLHSVEGKSLRPGFQAEFEIPRERLQPPVESKPPLQPNPALNADMVTVSAGTYAIGVPYETARYYNEVPRFQRRLAAFQIDHAAAAEGAGSTPVTGVTYDEAVAACARRGARLPTEFEWEVAVGRGEAAANDPPMEWTASWYLPYPGNDHGEPEYGRIYRVVRGGPAGDAQRVHERHYFQPDARDPQIGYRCAREVAP